MIGPLPYIGGKNRLANRIIALLPEHITYVEPFAGGAQVLFHKPPSSVEVLNDLDFDTANFFRVCQWHYQELVRYLGYCLVIRKLHELHRATDPATLTDIQRAGRFFYLQKNSFGGLVVKHNYHYLFFGFVNGLEDEFGYFCLSELESARISFGLSVEHDAGFQPGKLTDVVPAPDI